MHTYSQDKTGRSPVAQPRLQKNGLGAAVVVQTKLSIGQPGDAYEQEADSVADLVVNQSTATSGPVQKQEEEKPRAKVANLVQREPKDELQMKPETSAKDAPGNIGEQITSTEGSGMALPPKVRREMESGIGANFNQVRIHTGPKAENMSQQLNAQAFTLGSNIYFNKGKYNPGSNAGKHLLANEHTHTVQQGKSRFPYTRDRVNTTTKPMIQREIIESEGKPHSYRFVINYDLFMHFLGMAQKRVKKGPLNDEGLLELINHLEYHYQTVNEISRLFLAGLCDAPTAEKFSKKLLKPGFSFSFPLSAIKPHIDKIRNFKRRDEEKLKEERSQNSKVERALVTRGHQAALSTLDKLAQKQI